MRIAARSEHFRHRDAEEFARGTHFSAVDGGVLTLLAGIKTRLHQMDLLDEG